MRDKKLIKHERVLALLVLFLGIECLVLFVSTPVGAQIMTGLDQANNTAQLPKLASGDLSVAIGQVVSGVMGLIGSIMFLYLLYGGFRWMVAGGEAKGVSEAQSIIKNAVIGIAIIIFAYTLANFVIDRLVSVTSAPVTTTPASGSSTTQTCASPKVCSTDAQISEKSKQGLMSACEAGGCPSGQQCCEFKSVP